MPRELAKCRYVAAAADWELRRAEAGRRLAPEVLLDHTVFKGME